jgi:hypothetical protein
VRARQHRGVAARAFSQPRRLSQGVDPDRFALRPAAAALAPPSRAGRVAIGSRARRRSRRRGRRPSPLFALQTQSPLSHPVARALLGSCVRALGARRGGPSHFGGRPCVPMAPPHHLAASFKRTLCGPSRPSVPRAPGAGALAQAARGATPSPPPFHPPQTSPSRRAPLSAGAGAAARSAPRPLFCSLMPRQRSSRARAGKAARIIVPPAHPAAGPGSAGPLFDCVPLVCPCCVYISCQCDGGRAQPVARMRACSHR